MIVNARTDDAPRVAAVIARAVAATVPDGYTGKVTITLNYHRGTLGRITSAREEIVTLTA